MLSDKLLEELTRGSTFRDELITLAWPSLTTESKLQLLTELQCDGQNELPETVFELAGKDDAPIVRFWAIRFSLVPRLLSDLERAQSPNRLPWSVEHSEEAVSVAKGLQEDVNPFVKDAAELDVSRYDGPREPLNTRQRRLAVRFGRPLSVSSMVDWVSKLWEAGVADEEDFTGLVLDILHSPQLKMELQEDKLDEDGSTHFENVKTGRKLWELATRLPKVPSRMIGGFAPVVVERTNVVAEFFDDLPSTTQAAVVGRRGIGMPKIVERVWANPDIYEQRVIETAELVDGSNVEWPSRHEIHELQMLQSTDRIQSLLELTLSLSKQIETMNVEVTEVASRRRRFFGF